MPFSRPSPGVAPGALFALLPGAASSRVGVTSVPLGTISGIFGADPVTFGVGSRNCNATLDRFDAAYVTVCVVSVSLGAAPVRFGVVVHFYCFIFIVTLWPFFVACVLLGSWILVFSASGPGAHPRAPQLRDHDLPVMSTLQHTPSL